MDIQSARSARKQIRAQFAQVLSGQQIKPGDEPDGEIEEGEQPVGTLNNPSTRSLYSLLSQVVDVQRGLARIALPDKKDIAAWLEAKRDVEREQSMTAKLGDAIKGAFWLGIMEEHPQAADKDSNSGIRSGWQVVVEPGCECVSCSLKRVLESEGPNGLLDLLLADEIRPELLEALPPEMVEMAQTIRSMPKELRELFVDENLRGRMAVVEVSLPRRA